MFLSFLSFGIKICLHLTFENNCHNHKPDLGRIYDTDVLKQKIFERMDFISGVSKRSDKLFSTFFFFFCLSLFT
jgi:hypothetical protein